MIHSFAVPTISTGSFNFNAAASASLGLDRVEFRGNNERIQTATDSEIILTGPTRTGKTRAILHKIYKRALEHNGLRALILRKYKTDLAETTLVTLERDILGQDHPIVINGPSRDYRRSYRLANGSELVVGGLDKPGKILGSDYDIIFVSQAEELNATDWEYLITRLSSQSLPPDELQILGDCNPQGPYHWIFKRSLEGGLKLLETTHKDNPLLYDRDLGDWTPFGRSYLKRLSDSLTGTTRDRLYKGLWVQAEGVVYASFSATIGDDGNLTDVDPDFGLEGSFEVAVDDGYIDPRVFLLIWKTPTEIIIFDEIYHSRHLPKTCVDELVSKCIEFFGSELDNVEDPDELDKISEDDRRALAKIPRRLPAIAVGSPEAKVLHRYLRAANIPVRNRAIPSVVEALGPVRSLIKNGDGYRSLKVNSKRCKNLVEEITGGYQYPKDSSRGSSEKPLDKNNHACDALRDWVWLRAR